MEVVHCDTPMGNCAVRILYGGTPPLKAPSARLYAKECKSATARSNCFCAPSLTGDRERDPAQFFGLRVVMFFLHGWRSGYEKCQDEDLPHHLGLHLGLREA